MTRAAHPAPPDQVTAISAFLSCAAEQVSRHDSEIAREMARALKNALAADPVLGPATTPASVILPAALEGAHEAILLKLRDCAEALHWRRAGFGNLPESASQHLAVTELVGPNGMFRMADVRVGLLIQHPGFQYLKHSHAAEELYLVLKGTADWAVDDAAPGLRPPGSFIHHRSFQPHRMTTHAEPLLALWGWTGDVTGSTYSI